MKYQNIELQQQRSEFEAALSKKPEAMFWNASDAMFWAWQAARKCNGNHGGPRCADPECWNDSPQPSQIDRQGRGKPVGYVLMENGKAVAFFDEIPTDGHYAASAYTPVGLIGKPAEPVKVPSDEEIETLRKEVLEAANSKGQVLSDHMLICAALRRYGQPAQPAASAEPVCETGMPRHRMHKWFKSVPAGTLLYTAPVAAQPSVPDILFDGWAVLQAIDDKARERTLAIHVADVLDAVVRLIRATPPADGQAQQESPHD